MIENNRDDHKMENRSILRKIQILYYVCLNGKHSFVAIAQITNLNRCCRYGSYKFNVHFNVSAARLLFYFFFTFLVSPFLSRKQIVYGCISTYVPDTVTLLFIRCSYRFCVQHMFYSLNKTFKQRDSYLGNNN